ncbi:MAG: hypothetical protein AB1899_10160 [Pseudomonadota bacterium]
MIDDIAATAQTLASTPQQASILAIRLEAQSQQAVADLLARQAEEQAQTVQAPSNPEGVGGNVDTFA